MRDSFSWMQVWAGFFLSCTGLYSTIGAAPPPAGEHIYRNQCAECHGDKGQGVKGEYKEPLIGDWSLQKLTSYISKNMPEENPKLCVGEDADRVAKYIFGSFYSPAARANITLTRLTNRQYRESVADLFRMESDETKNREPGLKASYFDSKGMNKKDSLKHKRVDPRIDFEFGAGSPIEGIKAEQFSIAWEGSLRTRETGFHEFRVTTPNGARLYVNVNLKEGDKNYRDDASKESQHPLIDAWVSSGNKTRTETARLFLLGGRDYPIRLDYFKYKEKTGSIRLEWLPPGGGAWAVPGEHDFSPHMPGRQLVVQTPFPPDDRSLGYERGSDISREWLEATTLAAVEVANQVDQSLGALTGARAKDADKVKRLKHFSKSVLERAFRRPLSMEESKRYMETRFTEVESPEVAVKRVIMLALKSPHFLYPNLPIKERDAHGIAARLALGLWDSIPDEQLRKAANLGKTTTRTEVAAQARRMLQDRRTRSKVQAFFRHWLDMDSEHDLMKDSKIYPDFGKKSIADLRHSLNLFIDEIVWSQSSDYRQLLLARHLPLNGTLAKLYGKNVDGEEFQRIEFEPGQRAGLITHPYLLSSFAYPNNSSPIHRGVFLSRQMLGRALKPPPEAVSFKEHELDADLSMREKVTMVTSDKACMNCHGTINSLGFSLEHYDALGRWRKIENNKPVNAASDYETEDGKKIRLQGARSLAEFAVNNERAQKAFVRQLFQYMVKQPVDAYGEKALENLHRHFKKNQFNIKSLIIEIICVSSMHGTGKPLNENT